MEGNYKFLGLIAKVRLVAVVVYVLLMNARVARCSQATRHISVNISLNIQA